MIIIVEQDCWYSAQYTCNIILYKFCLHFHNDKTLTQQKNSQLNSLKKLLVKNIWLDIFYCYPLTQVLRCLRYIFKPQQLFPHISLMWETTEHHSTVFCTVNTSHQCFLWLTVLQLLTILVPYAYRVGWKVS